MTFDPNREPDLRSGPGGYRRSSPFWGIWVAILAVVVIGGVAWYESGDRNLDKVITSSTTKPATVPGAPMPAPAPTTPAPPAAQPNADTQP
jgi:hypothetical protein